MRKFLIPLLGLLIGVVANTQTLPFPRKAYKDSASMTAYMPGLAKAILPLYRHEDRKIYQDNLFRFHIVAEEYYEAIAAMDSLLKDMGADQNDELKAMGIQYRAYAMTMLNKPTPEQFNDEFIKTLKHLYSLLPEKATALAANYFDTDPATFKVLFDGSVRKLENQDSLSLADAAQLCRAYNTVNVMSKILKIGKETIASLQSNQFNIQDSVLIRTRSGATISATIIHRKDITTPLPAVFVFNIYAGPIDRIIAREAATRGYVGIVANTRGKRLSPQDIDPFEFDASDSYEIIDWISKQPWCNGKVGMYGGSYLGFSQWATAKKMHPALKTIVPQVAVGIGIDYPMYNNIFMGYMLQWIHYVTNNKLTDMDDFGNYERWDSFFKKWYVSGKSFRSLDSLEGRPNKIFQRWLNHPSHDNYWQNMVAYKNDFANINIPILTTTGYYDDDQVGALYYFNQHHLYNKNANHYLLIGPYNHSGAQGTPASEINGYKIDSAALINITDITYKWFDYIMKDSSRPALLKDKINMQVMGANTWKHVPVNKISNDTLTFYLSNIYSGAHYKLLTRKPAASEFIRQEINLQYRGDTMGLYDKLIVDALPIRERLCFVSEPLESPLVLTGAFLGQIKAAINKKDFDFSIRLYEQMPDGKYFELSNVLTRASYARDRSKRNLLRPGVVETIPFNHSSFTCRQLRKGSRIILLVGMHKNYNWQINYGTGKDVSDETIADGKEPMKIQWFNQSFVQIPVLKPAPMDPATDTKAAEVQF